MIVSELVMQVKNKTEVNKWQKIVVKCDKCDKLFNSTYTNRNNSFIKYNQDMCLSCKFKNDFDLGIRKPNDGNTFRKYNASVKGKTSEERLGKEKSDEMKTKMSQKQSGSNNINFGGKYSHGFADRPLTGPIEERYGKEKSNEMKTKMSQANSGSNNPMFGKPSPKGSGNGWAGWYKDYYFRSLLELSYLIHLDRNGIKFEQAEHYKYRVEYIDWQGNKRNYFPDFYLIDTDEVIEIKPKHLITTIENSSKFNAAKLKYKNFRVITEDDIIKLTDNDIKRMYESKDIKFIERYEIKYKEKYQ